MASYDDIFEPVEHPNEVVLLVGGEGSGKTHLACTAPGPIYAIGTESGHEMVTMAKEFPDKDIRHLSVHPEGKVGEAPDIWFGAWWGAEERLSRAVTLLENAPKGTVVIDSASDLLGIAAAAFNVQRQRADKPIPPMMYGSIYSVLQGWIGGIREHHNLIMTAKLKDEYKDDTRTGDKTIDLWRTGTYFADHVAWVERAPIGDPRVARVTKGVNDGRVLYDPTWGTIVNRQPPEEDARPLLYTLKRLSRGYDYFEAQGEPVVRTVPETREGAQKRLAELRNAAQGGEGDDDE